MKKHTNDGTTQNVKVGARHLDARTPSRHLKTELIGAFSLQRFV
jgi:hypothetical protein